MGKSIGIYVSSDQHLDQVLHLCRAAKKKGVDVNLFFTHIGTRLALDPRITELQQLARVALCKVGFEDNQLARADVPLDDRAFASQSYHAEMIYDCDRYLTF